MYTQKKTRNKRIRDYESFEAFRAKRIKTSVGGNNVVQLPRSNSDSQVSANPVPADELVPLEAAPALDFYDENPPALNHESAADNETGDIGASSEQDEQTLPLHAEESSGPESDADVQRDRDCVATDIPFEPRLIADEAIKKPEHINDFGRYICALQAKKQLSKGVATKLIKYMQENSEVIGNGLLKKDLKSFKQIRTAELRRMPKRKVDVLCKDSTNNDVIFKGCSKFPKTAIATRELQLVYELSYTTLSDISAFHALLHPGQQCSNVLDFSVDDVPETISGGVSISVLSVQFTDCRNVYTVAILRPAKSGMGLSESIILEGFLKEVTDSAIKVRYGIADAPKRAKLQGLQSHSANYCCQYCLVKKNAGGIGHIDSRNANARELRSVKRIIRKLNSGVVVSDENRKGVKEESPLACLRNFNYLSQVPAERMHLLDLGLVRKMMSLMFKIGKVKKNALRRASYKHRRSLEELNAIVIKVQLISDFSRRSRALDKGSWKAQEFRNLVMAMFPAVAQTCPPQCKEVWLYTVFIYRALMLPSELYAYEENREKLARMLRRWYYLFESTFGLNNCSYNVHTVSHVLAVRDFGPLTETSAVRFEDQYQVLKGAFVGGTMSTGLQALENLYVGLAYDHSCQKSIDLKGRRTAKVNDRLVYLKSGQIIEIASVLDDVVEGNEVATEPGLHLLPGYDFNEVLCFKRDRLTSRAPLSVATRLCEIAGKCVECCGFISVIPINVLRE